MKRIKNIKKGLLQRNTSLLKYAMKTGVTILKHRDDPAKVLEELVGVNPKKFIDDLSHYKGSITKAGQLISQYGEYYLSEEVNEKLRMLHGSTHYLDFEKLEKLLPSVLIDDFQIDPSPIAAASIGQVHKAIRRSDKKEFAIKIQYEGIEKAIKGDLVFLKLFLASIKIVPKGIDTSDIFQEIEKVLKNEMDYKREGEVLNRYAELLDDDYYKLPKYYPEYSNDKVLCMDFVHGRHLSKIKQESTQIDQTKIDILGEKIFALFLKELFHLHLVQTDAHGGNYFIDEELEHLTLLDFGACLEYSEEQLTFYQNFLIYSFKEDKEAFLAEFERFISYTKKSLSYDQDILWEYMLKASSPLRSESFDWGKTKLPDELFEIGERLRKSMSFDSIPSDFIFIDRKVMGVFTLLRSISCSFNVKRVFEEYV
ncbi:AarF/UbiB family protein [Bacteriovorax sp. DB6_IX]|uniref:AarF/UbiB family protein n=1 Tax=Bacteriovorax sp. DB6_IX TaxID=1353530 RepID=UPI000554B038|nr:AarF/UbiB family protein [Bacteriovorax sp. DB6_IX]